jgi:hypothetical protein
VSQEADVGFWTVYDKKHRPVAAMTFVDAAGNDVVDPKTGLPLLVPLDYDINAAIAFGQSLRNMNPRLDQRAKIYAAMKQAFQAGGPHDLQRSYNWRTGGGKDEFVEAFRPAASYHLGVVGRAAGLTAPEIVTAAGMYNLEQRLGPRLGPWEPNPNIDTSGQIFNNPQNAVWIHEGIKAHDSGRFFKRTPMNEQGDEASRLAYGDRPDGATADLGPGRPAQASMGTVFPSPARPRRRACPGT